MSNVINIFTGLPVEQPNQPLWWLQFDKAAQYGALLIQGRTKEDALRHMQVRQLRPATGVITDMLPLVPDGIPLQHCHRWLSKPEMLELGFIEAS